MSKPEMSEPELPYKNKGDLTTGPIKDHLIRMSLPMVWSMLAVMIVQLTDMFFISMLGKKELTGMSFTFPVTMLISNWIFGINIAMSSVVSRLIGQGQMKDAKRVILHGVGMGFCFASLISLVAYQFLNPLFHVLGASAASMKVVWDYMPVWLIGSAFLAITVNSNSAVRATGDTRKPAMTMIAMAVINLILAPIFVFGLFGFPALHVFGAACATLVAILCSLFFALYILIIDKDLIPHDGAHLDKLKDSLKRLAVIAIPAGIGNIITPAMTVVITAILARQGADAVAAFGVASRVESMAMIVVIALAIGMSPLIGQNWGAKKYTRVHETITLAITYNFAWCFLMAIIFGLFSNQIGRVFTKDPAILYYVRMYFWLIPVTYGFGNLTFGWCGAFNAMGQPQRSFVMILIKSFVMTIPAALIGDYLYGAPGVFLGMALVNIFSGMLFQVKSWKFCLKTERDRALKAFAEQKLGLKMETPMPEVGA